MRSLNEAAEGSLVAKEGKARLRGNQRSGLVKTYRNKHKKELCVHMDLQRDLDHGIPKH